MSFELLVSREARADIAEAIAWLRSCSPALPERFRVELEGVYSSIVAHPDLYPIVYRRFHRALLRRFPYSVFYFEESGVVVVMGVVHQARDEAVWQRRA